MVPCPTLTTSLTLIQSNCWQCTKTIMTKEKIKELLQGVYSGWKNMDAVVDEIHESLNTVQLPSINKMEEEEPEWKCNRCNECEGDCLCEEND